MTEDVSRLVLEIRHRALSINTLRADFHSVYRSGPIPYEADGRTVFLRPDRMRSETTVNGKPIVSVRNGTVVRRYSPAGKDAWQYDLKDLPRTQPLDFGIADPTDPFFAVDEATLEYEGPRQLEGRHAHAFLGWMKAASETSTMDTRKGFSLQYTPKSPRVRLSLLVDSETGLLLEMAGTDQADAQLFELTFRPVEVNGPVEESLFTIDPTEEGLRVVDIKDLLISAMDPDLADQAPSLN